MNCNSSTGTTIHQRARDVLGDVGCAWRWPSARDHSGSGGVPLRWYRLKLDDFVYLSRSRSFSALSRHLATPHNGHVVPLFLCETHLLARFAGTMEALPRVLGWAAYATLLLAMAAAGHLVAVGDGPAGSRAGRHGGSWAYRACSGPRSSGIPRARRWRPAR